MPRRRRARRKANIVYINGARPTTTPRCSSRATRRRWQPKIDSGDYTLVGDQTGEWDADKAGNAFDGIFTANDGKVDGVVSANDTMAGGIIARLKANGLAGKVPVTGQDASVEGLQRILDGSQCMTVYKNTDLEAKAASELAIALINGDKDAADAWPPARWRTPRPATDVTSALATPEAIYIDGVAKVIATGSSPRKTSAPASTPSSAPRTACSSPTAVPASTIGGGHRSRSYGPARPSVVRSRPERSQSCPRARPSRPSSAVSRAAASAARHPEELRRGARPARRRLRRHSRAGSPRWSATTVPARAP